MCTQEDVHVTQERERERESRGLLHPLRLISVISFLKLTARHSSLSDITCMVFSIRSAIGIPSRFRTRRAEFNSFTENGGVGKRRGE